MSTAIYHPFRARLDAAAARSIRQRVRSGAAPRDLAAEYSVALSSIYDVIAVRTYPPRVVIDADDETLEALYALAVRERKPLEKFIAESLRAFVATVRKT